MKINLDNDETFKRFEDATKEEVLKLINEYGNDDNMAETQNDSPSVSEFLALADKDPKYHFHGYIICKPRDDYRVSIEGFEINQLNADDAMDIMQDFSYADEVSHQKADDGTYTIYTWWD